MAKRLKAAADEDVVFLREEKKAGPRWLPIRSGKDSPEFKVLYEALPSFPAELVSLVMEYTPLYAVANKEPYPVGEIITQEADGVHVSDGGVFVTRFDPETKTMSLEQHALVQESLQTDYKMSLQPIYKITTAERQPMDVLADDPTEDLLLLYSRQMPRATYSAYKRSTGGLLWTRERAVPGAYAYIGHGFAFLRNRGERTAAPHEWYPAIVDVHERMKRAFRLKHVSTEHEWPVCLALTRSLIVHCCPRQTDEKHPTIAMYIYKPNEFRALQTGEPLGMLATQSEVELSLSDTQKLRAVEGVGTLMEMQAIGRTTETFLLQVYRQRAGLGGSYVSKIHDPCDSVIYVINSTSGRALRAIDIAANQCAHALGQPVHFLSQIGPSYLIDSLQGIVRFHGVGLDVDAASVDMKVATADGDVSLPCHWPPGEHSLVVDSVKPLGEGASAHVFSVVVLFDPLQ